MKYILSNLLQSGLSYLATSLGPASIGISDLARYVNYAQTPQVQKGSNTNLCISLLLWHVAHCICNCCLLWFKYEMERKCNKTDIWPLHCNFVLRKMLGGSDSNEWKKRQHTLQDCGQIIEISCGHLTEVRLYDSHKNSFIYQFAIWSQ